MKITRKFTAAGADPFSTVKWTRRSSRITNPDGSVVFQMDDAEVPETWSQLATDIMVSKYFRRAGVPVDGGPNGIPADGGAKKAGGTPAPPGKTGGTPVPLAATGGETSARQVIHRLAGCWRHWGEKHGYFDTPNDAQAFYDELVYMLVHQAAAPNSPQWFNTGLNWAYGITGPAQGHYVPDPKTGKVGPARDAYTHPQPHACQPFKAPISTPQGPVPIGEIVKHNLIGLEVFDGTDSGRGTTKVVAVESNGEKPVWRIVLKNGAYIEATPDHVVFALPEVGVPGAWVRVDALSPGMRMHLATATTVSKESSEAAVLEAGLAGWLQGDGFVGQYQEGTNRSLTIEFMTINQEEFDFVLASVGRVLEGVHYHVRSVTSPDPDLDIRRIRLYGEKLRPFVEKYGLLREGEDLRVPDAVLSAGRSAQAAYLRSIFQTDGTVRLRRRASRTSDVVLTTISHDLASGVQTLLANHGIYSRVQVGVEKRENRRTPYFVSIGYADARSRFRDMIGFVSSIKRGKLNTACSGEFPGKTLPALREETILRIEVIGTQPVFDIQTQSGQYLCNNVIVHNCFIQSVDDDLVNPGGIMDLWTREARLFKYGSGTGTNFSRLRAENESLSGGGKSSGLMSWLKIGDRAAGAIKSGGTTRRAAKMVCLDMDHPDIRTFINWKVREEIKVAAMVEGMKHLGGDQKETAERLGLTLDYDFNGEAYATVSGQNSNNSVRVPDEFFEAIDKDEDWKTFRRIDGKVARTFKARGLWDDIGFAAWRCADPGMQFDSTINAWHTCPGGGRINASNPCSEYCFLDNTACNLASINVLKFYDSKARLFDVQRYEHAIDLWTVVLEISVLMASYPSEEVARLSYKYRTLGLGYANLGAMLMQAGIPYDSPAALAVCGCLSAVLTGRSYRQSALMASQLGAFAGYEADRTNMLRVMRNHARAAHGIPRDCGQYEDLKIAPVPIDHGVVHAGAAAGVNIANADELLDHATRAWDDAVAAGEKYGYRNAQTTVIAPTGTIGLLMDCDTTGIEPDFALVKFKKLAGGGYFKIDNASVRPALAAIGYTDQEVRGILTYLLGRLTVDVPMPGGQCTFKSFLISKGLNEADIAKINGALPGVFEVSFALSAWSLGDEALARLGIDSATAKADPRFNLMRELGLTRAQIDALNEVICGTQTVEGAPHLKPEHLSVFDCANTCGKTGKRFIEPQGHIRMMAAAQPFISGAISKTINLPNNATVEDIKACYRLSWELGLKANALYRDGCKLSQPLSSVSDSDKEAVKEQEEAEKKVAATASQMRPAPTPAAAAHGLIESKNGAATDPLTPSLRHSATPPLPPEPPRPSRRRLPDTRASITHKFNIAGHEGYLTVGLYEDGMPGELFITMAKEGSTIGGLMDSLGTAVSVALQYGVPIESLVNKFTHQRFEPAGVTANRDIPFAKSLVDYIFRWMGMEFIPGYREATAPRRTPSAGVSADEDGIASSTRETDREGGPVRITSPSRPAHSFKEDRQWSNGGVSGEAADHAHGDQGAAKEHVQGSPANGAQEQHLSHGTRQGAPSVGSVVVVESVRATTRVHRTHNGIEIVRTASMAGSATAALSLAMQNNMGDAPACDGCGAITVRSGTCYKCLNCGNSMGCS